jgi:hypothetical protein
MNDPLRKTFAALGWVPAIVYDPSERSSPDSDRVDGGSIPNDPVQSGTFFQGDAEFELARQAYNDALAEWREVSDRHVPLAISHT